MSKAVTLELSEDIYNKFIIFAKIDNRTLPNFIETSALRYIEEHEYVDEFEMAEIDHNGKLQASLKRALQDVQKKCGNVVT